MHVTRVTQCCCACCHNSRHLINNHCHGNRSHHKLTNQTYKLVDLWECWVRNAQSLGCNTVQRSVVKDNHTVSMKCEPLQCQYGVVWLHNNITELVLTTTLTLSSILYSPLTRLGNTEYVCINFLGNLCCYEKWNYKLAPHWPASLFGKTNRSIFMGISLEVRLTKYAL